MVSHSLEASASRVALLVALLSLFVLSAAASPVPLREPVPLTPSAPAPGGNVGSAYCFGDGSGVLCPCAGFGAPGEGCPNSTGSGAVLQAAGSASLSGDTFSLHATNLPSNAIGLIVRTPFTSISPNGSPFGNGLYCLTGTSVQRGQVQSSVTGSLDFTDFHGAPYGAGKAPGDPDFFQLWYRDSQNACAQPAVNFSNAWFVGWQS